MNGPAAGLVQTVRTSWWIAVLAAALLLFATSPALASGDSSTGKSYESFAKLLGLLGGAIAWGYQFRGKMRREKIKADLEILQLVRQNFGANDDRVRSVEQKVSHLMAYLYRNPSALQLQLLAGANLVLSVVCAYGAYLIAHGVWRQEPENIVLPWFGAALLALFSVWSAVNAFDELKPPQKSPAPAALPPTT